MKNQYALLAAFLLSQSLLAAVITPITGTIEVLNGVDRTTGQEKPTSYLAIKPESASSTVPSGEDVQLASKSQANQKAVMNAIGKRATVICASVAPRTNDRQFTELICNMQSISISTESSAPASQVDPERKAVAKGMDLVDGAIVCPSMDEANWLFGQINMARHARLSLSPELRRQAMLIRGYDEGEEPKPSDYRCQFVPAGTPMNVKMEMGVIPVVWGTMKDGRPFAGVTNDQMIDR